MNSSLSAVLALALGGCVLCAAEPTFPVVPLWPEGPPGAAIAPTTEIVRLSDGGEHIVSNVHRPSLTVVLPAAGRATGAGIVVCPGGGHRELWMDHEGYAVARWLADHGIAAFILKYRLAQQPGSAYRVEVESLADAQRALRLVRHRAAEWNVDPQRVGIIGFSAGGELAALAAARAHAPAATNGSEGIEAQGDRPAFQALVYPGNAKALDPQPGAPPAFLVCGYDDNLTPPDELARAFLRFKAAGVPAELHIYTGAGHGFGLRSSNAFPAAAWPERLHEWLAERGMLRGVQ